MVNFTNTELADMQYLYGLSDGNAYETRRLYQERFPNKMVPDDRTISSTHIRLCETGIFEPSLSGAVLIKCLCWNYWRLRNWTFFLPRRLNGHNYRRFLEDTLPITLEDVPILMRNRMWFMHDGAAAHFSALAREYLNQNSHNRWIGRGGTE